MNRRVVFLCVFFLSASLLCASLFSLLSTPCSAMPLRPDIVDKLRAEGKLGDEARFMRGAYDRGVNHPPKLHPVVKPSTSTLQTQGVSAALIVERNAIVILVDFSDNVANTVSYPSSHYSDMLFSQGSYPTGSMRDYYIENSYGQFGVGGQVSDWLRMPQTYAYYVDGQRGFGLYPRNAQKLVEDAVIAANPYVDFSQFDNDGPDGIPHSGDDDGYVDAVFVVHAGPGYEETGNVNHIHSHQWSTSTPVTVDGVKVYTYSMEPDNGKIGVFCHEFGHVLGLPDLYDYDYNSRGAGYWSVMASGSWGNGGLTPTHFDAWSKSKLGFATPQVISSNTAGINVTQAETSPTSFIVWTNGIYSNEYFIVENREETLFDSHIPGSGLVVYHVDENALSNDNQCCGACPIHCILAVEQADGDCELENNLNSGDSGDPFPGVGGTHNPNTVFDYSSFPNSMDYSGNDTQVSIHDISHVGSAVQMGVTVETSPAFQIGDKVIDDTLATANGDGIVDPGETVDILVDLNNYGIGATNVRGGIHTSDPFVTLVADTSVYGDVGADQTASPNPPFTFFVSPACPIPHGIVFDMNVSCDPDQSVSERFFVGVRDSVHFYDWTHSHVKNMYRDQWHITTEKHHSPVGTSCWKCGSTILDNYADKLDAALYTVPFYVTSNTELTFWHWIEAEDYNSTVAWDGGVVEISVNDGPWQIITPVGGYPYTIKANPDSPFPGGTPCFSGISTVWKYQRFILSAYQGPARVRFRFGSDAAVGYLGWYIDEVGLLNAQLTSVNSQSPPKPQVGLIAAYPNPFNPVTKIKFSVAEPNGRVRLHIFDIDGRLVRELVDGALPAGENEVTWDGRDGRGLQVASGVYVCRMDASEAIQTLKLVLLR